MNPELSSQRSVVFTQATNSTTFIFRAVWIIFSLAVFFYSLAFFLITRDSTWVYSLASSTVGLLIVATFSYLQKQGSLAWQLVESAVYTLIILVNTVLSGGLKSPFLFALLFPPLSYYLKRPVQLQDRIIQDESAQIQAVSQERDHLQSILQSIQEGLLISDPHGVITFASRKAADILQTQIFALNNKPVAQVLKNESILGRNLSNFRTQLITDNGKKIIVQVNSLPLLRDGKIRGAIFIVSDVTGESELESMKLDFVAQAAHQLRTPLTILKSYLSVLTDSISTKLSPEEKTYLDRAQIGADGLSSLIENLLNVSKIESNNLRVNLVPAAIDRVIESAIQRNLKNAGQRGVGVQFVRPSGALPQVYADPELLTQALSNLVANGIDFSRPSSQVVVTTELQPKLLIVNVADKGVGIPSEATNKLFNKFFKVSGSLVQNSKGAGLGLFNAKAIIEAHHGTIWVNSILGKGSTFSFSLPIEPAAN